MNNLKNIKIVIGVSYVLIILFFLWFFFQNFSIQDFTSYELIKSNREILEEIKNKNIIAPSKNKILEINKFKSLNSNKLSLFFFMIS